MYNIQTYAILKPSHAALSSFPTRARSLSHVLAVNNSSYIFSRMVTCICILYFIYYSNPNYYWKTTPTRFSINAHQILPMDPNPLPAYSTINVLLVYSYIDDVYVSPNTMIKYTLILLWIEQNRNTGQCALTFWYHVVLSIPQKTFNLKHNRDKNM